METATNYLTTNNATRFPRDGEDLILKYGPIIKFIANRVAIRLPSHIDVDDMFNTGVLGLMDAVEKFDPERGVKFETYAEFRIKGAMLDELRALDWVPRSVRNIATCLEKNKAEAEKKLGRPANDEELAAAMDIETDQLHEFVSRVGSLSLISMDMTGRSNDNDSKRSLLDFLADGEDKTPLEILKLGELRDILANHIELLSEREKQVISLYYYDEMNMKEIGTVLDLTESRVSQIHTKAIMRLKRKLRKVLEEG